jgi:CBS domain-containing protein
MKAVVRDVMSAHPISVRKTASFKDIARWLHEYRVSAFPVLDDDGTLVGVVSEADLLVKEALDSEHHGPRELVAGIARRRAFRKAAGVTAGDLMTSPAVTVGADDTVGRAARLMYTRELKRLAVVDAAGRLTGIISRTDVLAVFDRPDEEIRLEITGQVIPRRSELSWYSVRVKDGVVTLEGTPETISTGHEVLDQIRRVQGVVAVRDRLVYPRRPVPAAPGPYF